MSKSVIDWPNLTDTLNPLGWGCYGPGGTKEKPNICGDGYKCYAKDMADKAKAGGFIKVKCQKCLDFEPHYHPERLKGFTGKKPKTIFVQSMGDLFGDWVSGIYILEVIKFCTERPQHTFMFLTKNPARYLLFDFPENCWLGWSITTGGGFGLVSMVNMNKVFLSIEPLLGSFDKINFYGIDLIIIGADSTPGAKPPPLEWVKSIQHPNVYYKSSIRKIYPELKNKGGNIAQDN